MERKVKVNINERVIDTLLIEKINENENEEIVNYYGILWYIITSGQDSDYTEIILKDRDNIVFSSKDHSLINFLYETAVDTILQGTIKQHTHFKNMDEYKIRKLTFQEI